MAFTANGVTWGDRTVTYSIATSNIAGQPGGAFGAFITSQAVINQIATAVSWWDGASGLTFQLVADSANVDIRFGYGVVDGGRPGGQATRTISRTISFPARRSGSNTRTPIRRRRRSSRTKSVMSSGSITTRPRSRS